MVGAASTGAGADGVFAPCILAAGEAACGVEASTGSDQVAMEPGLLILDRVELNDAAHFAPVLGGNAGGVDAHGLDVVGFDFRSEAGGAVIGERNAVDDELRLVLRAARVENRVAFIEPARLRVDEILQGPAGDGTEAMLDYIGANLTYGAGLAGVDQSVLRFDRNGLRDCG